MKQTTIKLPENEMIETILLKNSVIKDLKNMEREIHDTKYNEDKSIIGINEEEKNVIKKMVKARIEKCYSAGIHSCFWRDQIFLILNLHF